VPGGSLERGIDDGNCRVMAADPLMCSEVVLPVARNRVNAVRPAARGERRQLQPCEDQETSRNVSFFAVSPSWWPPTQDRWLHCRRQQAPVIVRGTAYVKVGGSNECDCGWRIAGLSDWAGLVVLD
jgi:hypothetical protein